MLKVYADFNSGTTDGVLTILFYDDKPLEHQMASLNLREGDKVVLYQDEGDFQVVGTLEFRDFPVGGRSLVARPDWSTIVEFS
jgi:hypothetical protein